MFIARALYDGTQGSVLIILCIIYAPLHYLLTKLISSASQMGILKWKNNYFTVSKHFHIDQTNNINSCIYICIYC